MGKLCHIRLLRPRDANKHHDGVSEKELAVLEGTGTSSLTGESVEKLTREKKPNKKKTKNLLKPYKD